MTANTIKCMSIDNEHVFVFRNGWMIGKIERERDSGTFKVRYLGEYDSSWDTLRFTMENHWGLRVDKERLRVCNANGETVGRIDLLRDGQGYNFSGATVGHTETLKDAITLAKERMK